MKGIVRGLVKIAGRKRGANAKVGWEGGLQERDRWCGVEGGVGERLNKRRPENRGGGNWDTE